MNILGYILSKLKSYIEYEIRKYQMSLLKSHGSDVYIGKDCIITYKNVSIGNDVYIGPNCCLQSAHGDIMIGSHVMFGPGVHIHGGNHVIDKIGVYMKDVGKKYGDDGIITVGDDVWIDSNAIILQGVSIGKGSVIGAGAIVTGDVPPYSIYTGVPEKKVRPRFTDEQIEEHERILKERGIF